MYKYEYDQKTTYHEKGLQKEKILRYQNYKLIIFSTIKNRFNKERDKLQKLDFEKR